MLLGEAVKSLAGAAGRSAFTGRDGTRVEIEFVTLHTTIAELPYMLSVVWPVSP